MSDAGRRLVYRPLVSRIATAGYAAFALWWAVDDLVTGDGRRIAVAGPVMLAIGAAAYGLFWRPAVVIDDEGVELRNIVRNVRVPWALLEGVETKYALTLFVGERRFRSWAAGAPGRPAPLAQPSAIERSVAREHHPTGDAAAVRSSRSLRGDSGAAAFMVEQRWEERRHLPAPADAAVSVRWEWIWPAATVAAALAAWAVSLAR